MTVQLGSNITDLFQYLKNGILALDPINFCEKYLTLDGAPFRINGNGYKPFSDIYRYIAIKGLEKDAKPVVLVKGRQVGATTMAAALELYFMCCGLFGSAGRPAIRIAHCFPQLELGFRYTKTKLNSMIDMAAQIDDLKRPGKKTSYIKSLLDSGAASNDSLQFKQFVGGNHIFIESTGLTGDRLRGMTVDAMFFDECFPYNTQIEIEGGKKSIGNLYKLWKNKRPLPRVKSYNENLEKFEYKNIVNAWKKSPKPLVKITCGNREIKCTENHRFLTENNGWVEAKNLKHGDLIKTAPDTKSTISHCNNNFKNYGLTAVDNVVLINEIKEVFDIEVEDNHNFIVTSGSSSKNLGGIIAHNCQDMRGQAIGNAIKALTKAQYGAKGSGIQVYFGTPKQRGSDYWKIWNASNQQYYHLGCEHCDKDFPLYTPGTNDWEKIWIEDDLPFDHPSHGFIVKCTHCGHKQDKRGAAERGKWVPYNKEGDKFIGYHINQLYMPDFTRAKIIAQKPENSPINTERTWQNEIVGEFFAGDASPITPEEIDILCADKGRAFSIRVTPAENKKLYLGCDWGQKVDVDQLSVGEAEDKRQQGQSYSCAVVLQAEGPHLLSIQYATRLKRNDLESKKGIVEQIFRQYSINMAIGDIGYANDLTEILQKEYGERFLASQAASRVNGRVKFKNDFFPSTVVFERDYHIAELYGLMKQGKIRFPYKDFEKIGWLIQHCCSMEIKPMIDRSGEVSLRYVKGSSPNDGFMALLNAYLAYKFDVTNGFNISNPNQMSDPTAPRLIPAVCGYLPMFNPLKRSR